MKSTTQIKHIKDVWQGYALQLLGLNSDWWGVYNNKIENHTIYRKVIIGDKQVIEEVFSYSKYRQIVDEFFIAGKAAVIAGQAVNLGNNVGKVCARRVERDHSNKQINWGRTSLQPKVINEAGKSVPKKYIYFTDDDYCRIGFHKTGRIKNETVYEFIPAEYNKTGTGFKQEFSNALKRNMLLKYRFLYFPLKKERTLALKEDSVKYKFQKQLAT